MERRPEPELMEEDGQARAYAQADFTEPHDRFVSLFAATFRDWRGEGTVLDLGCGPGDIAIRFAKAYPRCIIHGVDGSEAMLRHGATLLRKVPDLQGRIHLIEGRLPEARPPLEKYDAIICNSLLHHLADQSVLWEAVYRHAKEGGPVFVMDLLRPESPGEASRLVASYAADEPDVLRRDFFHSLLAAYTLEEIREQLKKTGLEYLNAEQVSDRHLLVSGHFRVR